MKFLILIYNNPQSRAVWQSLPPAQREAGLAAYRALDAELEASGELVVAAPLAPSAGTTVGPLATDGPFAEVKEFLAGFYVVDCDDAARARQIAARIPEAEFGAVEVRPTITLDEFA